MHKQKFPQNLAHYAGRIRLPGKQGLIASHTLPDSSPRKRRRSQSRGKHNTSFNQFLDATYVIRSAVKHIFIIWGLVLGIYALFHYVSRATWPLQSDDVDNTIVQTTTDNTLTIANTESIEDFTVTANQFPSANKGLTDNQHTTLETGVAQSGIELLPIAVSEPIPAVETAEAAEAAELAEPVLADAVPAIRQSIQPVIASAPDAATVEPVTEPVVAAAEPLAEPLTEPEVAAAESLAEPVVTTASDHSAPGSTLRVTAYQAVLFNAIDRDDAKQTPLARDSIVTLVERTNEWMKVTTSDTNETGYVHSSQVTAD